MMMETPVELRDIKAASLLGKKSAPGEPSFPGSTSGKDELSDQA